MPLAGAMPAAFACAVLSRYVDRVLHGLLPPSHVKGARPDALVLVLSVLMQLLASSSWWLVAEMLTLLGSAHLPSLVRAATRESVVGLAGVTMTVIAFVLPRIMRRYASGRPPAREHRGPSSSVVADGGLRGVEPAAALARPRDGVAEGHELDPRRLDRRPRRLLGGARLAELFSDRDLCE